MKKQFASQWLPAPASQAVAEARPPVAESPQPWRTERSFGNRALGHLLVDTAAASAGQMSKAEFLAGLEMAVTEAVDEALAVAGRTSTGCPWLAHWFRYYRDKSAAHLERAIHKFAPETATAVDATEYTAPLVARIRRSVERWTRTGELSGLPEGMPKPDARNPQMMQMSLGPGEAIDPQTRTRMESALGTDLGDVRIHSGQRAAELAAQVHAGAFTIGKDIAFAPGRFRPGTPVGDALLAHELAHVAQQEAGTAEQPGLAHERDANRAAAAGLAHLWNRSLSGARNVAQSAGPQMRSGLALQACSSDAFRTRPSTGNYVEFLNSHVMTRHAQDRRADLLWVPGVSDHAAAYTKGVSPNVAARTGVPANLTAPGTGPLSLRVKENGSVRGTRSGLAPSSGSVELTGLALTGLTGSDAVRSADYNLQWEGSADGNNWLPLMTSGPHRIYWLFDNPKTSPLYARAAAKATGYAAGLSDAQAVAGAIRSGIRRIDGLTYNPSDSIDEDPLSIYQNGVGICTDYANILTLLALSVGLNANAVMFFGGFQSLGKNVWVTLGSGLLSLLNVRSTDPSFNPTPASGWAFTYHAISRIEGTLHDAALDRTGIDGDAVHQGKIVHFVELAPAPLPGAARGVAYLQTIQRKDHLVEISLRDYGARITLADFGDVYPLHVLPGAASPVNVPARWSLDGGALPPGLTLNPALGLVSGTPTAAGTYAARIKTAVPNLENVTPVNLVVTP